MSAGAHSTLIMGIINVTPDSFSGDGLLAHQDYVQHAVAHAEQMLAEGADILDVGGESSRPGALPVALDEEIRRVVPVVSAIRKKFGAVPIAVDTIKAEVAEQSLQEGATILNDITALAGNARMAELAARHKVQVVLMHNSASLGAVSHDEKIGKSYDALDTQDIIADVTRDLKKRVEFAMQAGIARDKIIIDPGIGFGKTLPQNLALIANMQKIKPLGFPVMMALSRKSFIGQALDLPVDERLEGTAACTALCAFLGADIVRVHDVKFMTRIVKMATALREATLSD